MEWAKAIGAPLSSLAGLPGSIGPRIIAKVGRIVVYGKTDSLEIEEDGLPSDEGSRDNLHPTDSDGFTMMLDLLHDPETLDTPSANI